MDVEINQGSSSDIDRLGPLWLMLHHHHQQVLPDNAPYVSDAHSWASRRALYEQLLAKPDSVLLLAERDDELIGYGLAHVIDSAGSWADDTWSIGARLGEIESLGVLAEFRGQGIGAALLDRLQRMLTAEGVHDFVIGMLPGNPAMRLYERAGFRPTWMYLSRFAGRE